MEGFDEHSGTAKLAAVLSRRMKRENGSSLVLDFGEIQANYSLVTNTFPVPIPKGDYSICRGLTFGRAGSVLAETDQEGMHEHQDGAHEGHGEGDGAHTHEGDQHGHSVLVPAKMRSVAAGDRVLVAWVQNEAVVVDMIERS